MYLELKKISSVSKFSFFNSTTISSMKYRMLVDDMFLSGVVFGLVQPGFAPASRVGRDERRIQSSSHLHTCRISVNTISM